MEQINAKSTMVDLRMKPRNTKESRTLWKSTISTIILGALAVSLSLICVTTLRESRWNRLIMASLVTKFDDVELISSVEKDLLATITFSSLGIKETRKEKHDRKNSLRNETKEDTKNYRKEKQEDKKKNRSSHKKDEKPHDEHGSRVSKEGRGKGNVSIAGSKMANSTSARVTQHVYSDVSWLISFPNSGTTYTIHNTEQVSMRSTGTNYAMELHYKDAMIPVRENENNIANGPWQRNNTLPMPPVVLTKTHCTGYGDRAPLQNSILTTEQFLSGCADSTQYIDPNNRSNHEKKKGHYHHKDLVKSVIHLIRNPFDNIISRMHHGMKMRQKRLGFGEEQVRKFMESPKGVLLWCQISDKAFWMEEEIPKKITNKNKLKRIDFDADLLLKVPCHSEFFRYVQWHNAALRMVEQENLPSMVLYYEDYETKYDQTVDSVLTFLNLSREGPELPFTTGKTYRDLFFDGETQKATKELLKAMASKDLWDILEKYFPSSAS